MALEHMFAFDQFATFEMQKAFPFPFPTPWPIRAPKRFLAYVCFSPAAELFFLAVGTTAYVAFSKRNFPRVLQLSPLVLDRARSLFPLFVVKVLLQALAFRGMKEKLLFPAPTLHWSFELPYHYPVPVLFHRHIHPRLLVDDETSFHGPLLQFIARSRGPDYNTAPLF